MGRGERGGEVGIDNNRTCSSGIWGGEPCSVSPGDLCLRGAELFSAYYLLSLDPLFSPPLPSPSPPGDRHLLLLRSCSYDNTG